MKPHLDLAKSYWKQLIDHGDHAIDATCGNGYDTAFLAKLPLASLLSIDIQKDAIANAEILCKTELTKEELKKITFFLGSHSNLREFSLEGSPRLITYNLGYLPGGDKNFTTQTATTLASIQSALSIIRPTGAISIVCYPGHPEGKREERALLDYTATLSKNHWEVRYHCWINRSRHPSFLWIVRRPG